MRSGDLPAYLFLNGPSNVSFMLWRFFHSILALMSFRWRSIMSLVLYCFISVEISDIQLVCDRPTDGRTDGRTDRRTDIPSYRDARTHLKMSQNRHGSPFSSSITVTIFLVDARESLKSSPSSSGHGRIGVTSFSRIAAVFVIFLPDFFIPPAPMGFPPLTAAAASFSFFCSSCCFFLKAMSSSSNTLSSFFAAFKGFFLPPSLPDMLEFRVG